MKIEYKNKGSGKYICDTCQKRFDWSKDSWQYGKAEYATKSQELKEHKVFCSTGCKEDFESSQNEKKV